MLFFKRMHFREFINELPTSAQQALAHNHPEPVVQENCEELVSYVYNPFIDVKELVKELLEGLFQNTLANKNGAPRLVTMGPELIDYTTNSGLRFGWKHLNKNEFFECWVQHPHSKIEPKESTLAQHMLGQGWEVVENVQTDTFYHFV